MVNLQNPSFVFHSETNSPGGVMQLIGNQSDLFVNFGPNVKNNHELTRQRGSIYGLPYATAFTETLRAGLIPPLTHLYGHFPGKPKNITELKTLLQGSSRVESQLVERQVSLAKATANVVHEGVVIGHAHEDSFGGVHFLDPHIPVVASKDTLETIRLKEEVSGNHKDEVFEVKRRDLPKEHGKLTIEERNIVPVDFEQPVALGEFKKIVLHKADHLLGAAITEVVLPNGGPRVVNMLDSGVGANTEKSIETIWGAGDVDMLVLDATAIGGEKKYNEPKTNFRRALEERFEPYPKSSAFVEIPQRHMNRLVNLIEVAQKRGPKTKVYVPIDMAYYARTLLPPEMQDAFEIYLPQRYSGQYVPTDYPAPYRGIAFRPDGQINQGVLKVDEVAQVVASERALVVVDNPNHLMQIAAAKDISHRRVSNATTGKPVSYQNLYISAGYNYQTQSSTRATVDAAENAGLQFKEILITDHIPEAQMQEYLLAMTSKTILAVHTSNPESARAFVRKIQPKANIPVISRSALYEFTCSKGIRRVDI